MSKNSKWGEVIFAKMCLLHPLPPSFLKWKFGGSTDQKSLKK